MPIATRIFLTVVFSTLTFATCILACICYCNSRQQVDKHIYPEISQEFEDLDSDTETEPETVVSDQDNPIFNV